VHEFRPTLLRGWNAAWLFPGVAGETKTASMFSTQITQRIQRGRVMMAFSRLTDEAIVLRRLGHSEGH